MSCHVLGPSEVLWGHRGTRFGPNCPRGLDSWPPLTLTWLEKTVKNKPHGPKYTLFGPVEVSNDLNRVLHDISLYCMYCIVFDCIAWYCIASYCMALYCIWLFAMVLHGILLFCIVLHRLYGVVQLIWHAGELPRSASSHFKLYMNLLLLCETPPLHLHPIPNRFTFLRLTFGRQSSTCLDDIVPG